MYSVNIGREEDEHRVQCLLVSNLPSTPICFFVKRDCPPAAWEFVGSQQYWRCRHAPFRVKTTHISPSTSSLCGNSLKKKTAGFYKCITALPAVPTNVFIFPCSFILMWLSATATTFASRPCQPVLWLDILLSVESLTAWKCFSEGAEVRTSIFSSYSVQCWFLHLP